MHKYDTARPYAASYVLLMSEGKYLFVRRANTDWMNGYYSLPAGKVEKNEGFLAAAIREAQEEVGVTIAPEDLDFTLLMWRHEADEPDMEWCDAVFTAGSWQGEPRNAEPRLHDEIAWFPPDALPDNVIPHERKIIEAALRGKLYLEHDEFAK